MQKYRLDKKADWARKKFLETGDEKFLDIEESYRAARHSQVMAGLQEIG